ncbi:MAG: glycosyltransferase family 4 protein [Anaerolineae bacterium]|nr:glycosyltransferase family 4 protein [Anaerolineae bacterium]
MRLLFAASEFPPGPGGIGTQADQIARQLAALGWNVHMIAPQDYATGEDIAGFNAELPHRLLRIDAHPGSVERFLQRIRLIIRESRRWRPDIVLASGQRTVWLAALLTRIRKRRLAVIVHGSELGSPGSLARILSRWAINRADGVIAVSEFTRRQMFDAGIRPAWCKVIPNGADPDLFKPCPTDRIEAPNLLTVGHVSPRKGQDVVVRALPAILRQVPDAQYTVAGLPTEAGALLDLAEQLGVADHVHALGRVDSTDLVDLYNRCDVFVLTSRATSTGDIEGYGIAVVEAALCGKPSVVTLGSGLVEAIVDRETGVAVPQDDPEAAAEAILSLLLDREKRLSMGRAARERAIDEQTWAKRAQTYHAFLSSIVGDR